MDPTIKQMIDPFAVGFDSYRAVLGADHPEFKKAEALYEQLKQAGESAADFNSFFAAAGTLFEEVGAALTALKDVPPPEGGGSSGGNEQVTPLVSPYKARLSSFDRSTSLGEEAASMCERAIAIGDQASDALSFLVAVAKESIPGRLAAMEQRIVAQKTGEQSKGLSQPCLEHHYAVLGETMKSASTETAVEFEVNRLVELNSVENDWDAVLIHYMMKAIHETVGLFMDKGPEQQQTVENSYRFVCEFFGMDWEGIWAHPRVWDMWCMEYDKTKSTWISERDCHDPTQAKEYLTKLFDSVMKERPKAPVGSAGGQRLTMWETPLTLDRVPEIYSAPPRPEIDFSES